MSEEQQAIEKAMAEAAQRAGNASGLARSVPIMKLSEESDEGHLLFVSEDDGSVELIVGTGSIIGIRARKCVAASSDKPDEKFTGYEVRIIQAFGIEAVFIARAEEYTKLRGEVLS